MFCVVVCKCQFLLWFFQLDLKVVGNVLSMFIIVLSILSHSPFPIVWYGVVRDSLTPVISDKRLNSLLSNSFPCSCKIRFGNPKLRKYLLNNKSAAALPDLFLVGNACTNLLKWSTAAKRYSYPPLDRSRCK